MSVAAAAAAAATAATTPMATPMATTTATAAAAAAAAAATTATVTGGGDNIDAVSTTRKPARPANGVQEVISLPGELHGGGEYTSTAVSLDDKTHVQLKELCHSFKLPVTGNKATLQERLRVFGTKPQEWNAWLAPGARKAHRGPRQGPRKSALKASAVRRQQLFAADASTSHPQLLVVERSKDTRTEREKANLLLWVGPSSSRHLLEHANVFVNRPPEASLVVARLAAAPLQLNPLMRQLR